MQGIVFMFFYGYSSREIFIVFMYEIPRLSILTRCSLLPLPGNWRSLGRKGHSLAKLSFHRIRLSPSKEVVKSNRKRSSDRRGTKVRQRAVWKNKLIHLILAHEKILSRFDITGNTWNPRALFKININS